MATKRISELTLRSNFDATCNVPVDDSTQSYRTTGQQIRNFIAPLTTIGDLLFATTAGAAERLGIGYAQQLLRPVAGVPAWVWPYANQATKTTTYAISATGDHVILLDATSAAFTTTLPTAASVAGKTYILKKIDSTLNAVTIATTSSQTIDGVVGSSLNTQYETLKVISDGTNWLILDRRIPNLSTVFTMVITGSVSNPTKASSPVYDLAVWSREGDKMRIKYNYRQTSATGAAAGSGTYLFGLPTGATIDTAKVTANASSNLGPATLIDSSTGSGVGYVQYNTTSKLGVRVLNEATGLNLMSSGVWGDFSRTTVDVSFDALFPVSGWNG